MSVNEKNRVYHLDKAIDLLDKVMQELSEATALCNTKQHIMMSDIMKQINVITANIVAQIKP